MRSETKLQISAIVFIIIVGLSGIYSFLSKEKKKQELLAEAKAEIVEVQPKYSRESDGLSVWDKIQSFSVTYRFEMNGQKFERTEEMPRNAYKNFKVGEIAKVCYNPQNLNEIKLFLNTHVCGK